VNSNEEDGIYEEGLDLMRQQKQKLSMVIDCFGRAPNHIEAQCHRALLQYNIGDYNNAMDTIERIEKKYPNDDKIKLHKRLISERIVKQKNRNSILL
jgi:hypothetical protein